MKLCVGSLSHEVKLYEFIKTKCSNLSNLESFFGNTRLIRALTDLKEIWLMIDSGAFSFAEKYIKSEGGTERASYSFVDSVEFKAYLEKYIAWLHQHKHEVGVYVTLDVIGSAEKTWDIFKYMESCGLKPIPVFHYFEDFKWLDKYIDNYQYIGIGGVARAGSSAISFLDTVFKRVGQTEGKVNRLLHAFGRTDWTSLTRYPWYSVDSMSWKMYNVYGLSLFPQFRPEGYGFVIPVVVKCSNVRSGTGAVRLSEYINVVGRHTVEQYLSLAGIQLDNDIDKILELSINRDKLNLFYFALFQKYLANKTDWDIWHKNQRTFI